MEALAVFENQVIPYSALSAILDSYARPNDKINRLTKQGKLIALKRGLYALSDQHSPPKELIANHLFGPSYVSRQWALSYYGLLSERVVEVTSMCIGRSRQFENELGRFSYHAIPAHYYSLEQTSIQQGNSAFLMATPEKALCDLLLSIRHLRLQSTSAVLSYLSDDLRLNEAELAKLDTRAIRSFAQAGYKVALLNTLADALEVLHD
ncbi:type IV toxin-antitoxin system AbiEi family antitoxin domain-containing protein [Leucothrix pacifica]|uniref:Transcriptional regulator, AbiEi antitoxin, Type IV TA system n=1 Tax=Leucothrix pacifica TaxID=1247513 RepID=A0A317C2F2_9GAMM|nr:hypothetical protein [Leucothrix pacifica]PWQ92519.1 hypothetical protein DKW60_20695 [Leucothrix pacifica]